jgi:hypothetical protein
MTAHKFLPEHALRARTAGRGRSGGLRFLIAGSVGREELSGRIVGARLWRGKPWTSSFSTDDHEPARRYAAWRDAICDGPTSHVDVAATDPERYRGFIREGEVR